MSSSTDKISLQENRIGDSSTVEATDTDGEVADISDAVFEFSKREICWPPAVLHLFPNREILLAKLVLHRLIGVFLTQWWLLRLNKLQRPHPQLKVKTSLTQANLYLPFFEEKESFGFYVADVIAQRVNNAYLKPLESRLRELRDKYKSAQNCKFLCVAKDNLEL